MARIRTIKPELWSSDKFGECSTSARLMFVASLNFADDNGNLDRSARQLKAQTLPYDEGQDGEALVAELLRAGLFIEYKIADRFYLHIKNFEVHQKIDRPSKSRLPLYDSYARTQPQLIDPSPNPRRALGAVREGKVRDLGKDKSKISIPSESHSGKPEIAQVFEHWKSVWNHPRASLDPKRTAAISRALKGYSVDALCQAISGYRNSPHHTGQNDRNTVFDDIGLFLRDAAHIDAGLRFAEAPPSLSSELTQHNVAVLRNWKPPEDHIDAPDRRAALSIGPR